MISAPLAHDEDGVPFELPDSAAWWRVKKCTGGRPAAVLGPDDEPLFIAILDEEDVLLANGCSGELRLEAVDQNRKKIDAPVACVHLDPPVAHRSGVSSNGDTDLVRATVEANTRAMEAMQRTQVEQVRASAQRERALLDSQAATNQAHMDLIVALLDRMAPAEKQEPVALLKRQLEFQRVFDQAAQRNALPANGSGFPNGQPKGDDDELPKWLKKIAPFAPSIQEAVVAAFSNGDEGKAESLRSRIAPVTRLVAGIANEGTALVPGASAAVVARRHRPKAVREILAMLDEDEAQALERVIDGFDDAHFQRLALEAASIPDLTERVGKARALLSAVGFVRFAAPAETSAADEQEEDEAPEPPDVPPALRPIFAKLSPEEVEVGEQMIALLDLATVEKLVASLADKPMEEAVAAVRRSIEDARRRGASVAQRAVQSIFEGGKKPDGSGGGAR
jgi:hypothetical protein